MKLEELKSKLTQAADFFYREQNEEGIELVMSLAVHIGAEQKLAQSINPLFDALEQEDYILSADILEHEMSKKL